VRCFARPVVVFSRCLGFAACRYDGTTVTAPVVGAPKPYVDTYSVAGACSCRRAETQKEPGRHTRDKRTATREDSEGWRARLHGAVQPGGRAERSPQGLADGSTAAWSARLA
jgi:hypothetical protein